MAAGAGDASSLASSPPPSDGREKEGKLEGALKDGKLEGAEKDGTLNGSDGIWKSDSSGSCCIVAKHVRGAHSGMVHAMFRQA